MDPGAAAGAAERSSVTGLVDLEEYDPAGSDSSSDAVVVAEAIGIGEMVSYYSTTHRRWVPAVVVGYHFVDGALKSYNLNIQRHAHPSRIREGPMPDEPPTTGLLEGASSAEVADASAAALESVPSEAPDISGQDEALSAVAFSDSVESDSDIDGPLDAGSIASTEAPGVVGHGRRAPRPARRYPQGCPCDCQRAPAGTLGPRSRRARRCCCPMCGHRRVERGHGCHVRMEVGREFRGVVICTNCRDFCLDFLRWGDVWYDHGQPWPYRNP